MMKHLCGVIGLCWAVTYMSGCSEAETEDYIYGPSGPSCFLPRDTFLYDSSSHQDTLLILGKQFFTVIYDADQFVYCYEGDEFRNDWMTAEVEKARMILNLEENEGKEERKIRINFNYYCPLNFF